MNASTEFDPLNALRRVENGILAFMKWAIIIAMTNMIFAVTLQILTRYVLPTSLSWTEEAARLSFICLVFMGAAVLARTEDHLTVNVLTTMLPERMQNALAAVASLVGLFCAGLFVAGSWATLLREWDQLTPALQIPMGFIFAIIFGSTVLMAIWLTVVLAMRTRLAVMGENT